MGGLDALGVITQFKFEYLDDPTANSSDPEDQELPAPFPGVQDPMDYRVHVGKRSFVEAGLKYTEVEGYYWWEESSAKF